MKTTTRLQSTLIAAGFSAALALSAGSATAEDFNPQPDPPGKAQTVVKGAHNPPADRGAHNPPADKGVKGQHNPQSDKTGAANKATGIPPGFKSGAVDKATGIPPGFKTEKSSDTKVLLPAVHDANKAGSDKTIKLDTSKVGAVEATK